MNTDELEIHVYEADDWAVKRWDWFNGGRRVTPKSFCQFWRCVFLWATMKQILGWLPFLFWMFPPTEERLVLRRERERERPSNPNPELPNRMIKFLDAISFVVALLFIPVALLWIGICKVSRFIVVACIGGCIDWTADCCKRTVKWFSDRPKLVKAANGVMIFFMSALIIGFLVFGIYWLYRFGEWVWPRWEDALQILGAVVGGLAVFMLLLAWCTTDHARRVGSALLDFFHGVGSAIYTTAMMLRAAKRGVCPPMEIRGRD